MTRREYDRYRIFHNISRNVISIYDFTIWKFIANLDVSGSTYPTQWVNLPYFGHILEWYVNFKSN